MKILYKSLLGIVLIAVLFLFCNWIYEKKWWQEDIKGIDDTLLYDQLKASVKENEVLYFAESSNASFAATDTVTKSISELTNDCFPGLRMKAIEKGALHAGVFKNLIRLIPDQSNVKTVVVTMNLRSFDSNWIHAPLENYCLQLNILYNNYPPLYNKMRLVFKMYDYKEDWERLEDFKREMKKVELYAPFPLPHKTVSEWDGYIFHHPFLNEDGSWDNTKTALACTNVKIFAFNIDTLRNPRIKDFDEIVEICKKKNIRLYFNLLAENTQYADSLVGKELVGMMRINRDLLVERYTRKGVTVIDNLESVDGKDYIDQNWTSEHYNQKGRKSIARNLAGKLKKQFPEYYKGCD